MPPRLVGFAYTAPATPFGLNAEPRAVAAFPGVTIVTSHDWFGCPFVPSECGSPANAVLPSTQHKAPPASVVISIGFITNMIRSHSGVVGPKKNSTLIAFTVSRDRYRLRFFKYLIAKYFDINALP